MEKGVFGWIIFFIILVLFVFYWFPFNTIEFGFSGSKNTNFTGIGGENRGVQFYDNLRYEKSKISYNIDDNCTLEKEDEMLRAFQAIEDSTILTFYSVSQSKNPEISVSCDEKTRFEGKLFVAGEGGPTNITQGTEFNVIHNGGILILRDSECAEPNIEIHELLHALGFDHSKNPNNVMYPVSKCNQEIGQDTIDLLNQLYSFPSQPDLLFENASASMSGRYLDVSMVVRNYGLSDSKTSKITIYADNSSVKEIDVEPISVGSGRIMALSNILILQRDISEIKIEISYDSPELSKSNNEIILSVKS